VTSGLEEAASVQEATTGTRDPALASSAALYLAAVVAVAAGAAIPFDGIRADGADWLVLGGLTFCASLAQLLVVPMPGHQAYYSTTVFFLAGALLLPPTLVALLVLVAHLPEWARHRYPWYIQTFNIANYTCASVAAGLVLHGLLGSDHDLAGRIGVFAAAGVVAATTFVFVNHLLLAHMLRLARATSYRASGLFTSTSLSIELVLATIGVAAASVWLVAPPIVPFVLAPVFLAHRTLELPRLQKAARLDAKTELLNARYVTQAVADELERAKRFERPLSIVLADLDLLREVNNTYGHLAGDAVIRGVADVLRAEVRSFDVAGRFGGEEFAIVLPETDHAAALEIAERIRGAVARTRIALPTSEARLTATLSLGVASYPACETVEQLLHEADVALYRSKALGRNVVSGAERDESVGRRGRAGPAPGLEDALAEARRARPALADESRADPRRSASADAWRDRTRSG
jgi:diguanylate cyclase (GGDEF)-like protein